MRGGVFASSPISTSRGGPTEAASPSQEAFEALTSHHQNSFLEKTPTEIPGTWLFSAAPVSPRTTSRQYLYLLLRPVFTGVLLLGCAGEPASPIQIYTTKIFCWPFPTLQTIPSPSFIAGNHTASPPLLIRIKAPSFISAHNYFLLRCCTALQLFSSPDRHSGSPRTQKTLILPFHYPDKQIYRGQKKRKGRICFPLTCLLEKQITSVALTNPNCRKQNMHTRDVCHTTLKNFQNQLLQG